MLAVYLLLGDGTRRRLALLAGANDNPGRLWRELATVLSA